MYVKMFAVLFVISFSALCSAQLPKEAYVTVPQLISSAGYPVEKYRVTTADGYILQIFRIPAGRRTARKTGSAKGKKAVLLMHGLMGCSSNFLIMGPERSLGYLLADAGYDVWLGNLRGNSNTAHKNLTRADPQFWKFSLDEHGKYDLPAIIDKVLEVTGLEKILYIGHSMGTTSFFVMMSEKPEYNEKIVAFVALAPAVYLANNKAVIEWIVKDMNLINRMKAQGLLSSNLFDNMWKIISNNACRMKRPQENLCVQVISLVMGEDNDQLDMDMLPVCVARVQPGSWQQYEHYAKIALTDVFTAWEDGLNGAVRPYKLTNVRVPVVLVYGENDRLTEKSQVLRLADELRANGVLEEIKAAKPKINHIDFIFAKDISTIINKPLIKTVHNLYNKYGS
ncbi:unnamed protein product [Colias eurytheme]|nr:unnamed protein product [Colias eurytheme]